MLAIAVRGLSKAGRTSIRGPFRCQLTRPTAVCSRHPSATCEVGGRKASAFDRPNICSAHLVETSNEDLQGDVSTVPLLLLSPMPRAESMRISGTSTGCCLALKVQGVVSLKIIPGNGASRKHKKEKWKMKLKKNGAACALSARPVTASNLLSTSTP